MENIEKSKAIGPYQVEVEQIIKEIGDLESIRTNLGLSRRKICKLLLVDPSSWTRWTKSKSGRAPAYIYRSLQWCLAIMEKYPEAHPLVRSLSYEKENKVDQVYKKIEDRLSFQRSASFEMRTELDQIKLSNCRINRTNTLLKTALSLNLLFFIFILVYVVWS